MTGKLAYIGLGANLGDRLGSLRRAVEMLASLDCASAARTSRVYESPPWGYASANAFLNAVVELRWNGTPEELHEQCTVIETALGRVPRNSNAAGEGGQRYRDRVIDLDLLWFEGTACSTTNLTLPHPRAHMRAFVLKPWLELAPDLVLNGCMLSAWLAQLDPVEVEAAKVQPELSLALPELG